MKAALEQIAAGLLFGAAMGVGLFCMLMPEDAGASEPPSYPVLILVHEQRGCPAGNYRAFYLRDSQAEHEFCWHNAGNVILITAGRHVVARVPASRFRLIGDPVDELAVSTKNTGASQ